MSRQLTPGVLSQNLNPVAYLIDLYPTAKFAFSLRRLKTGVADVIEVRRTGDNFLSNFTPEQVSNGTLTSWVVAGGGTQLGHIKTLYDQTGNDRHLIQDTTTLQPVIVNAGVLNTVGGKPSIYFGTDHYLRWTNDLNQDFIQPNQYFISTRLNIDGYVYAGDTNGRRNDYYTLGRVFAGTSLNSLTIIDRQIHNTLFNGANSRVRVNGVQTVIGDAGTNSLRGFILNSRYSLSGGADQDFQELICWNDKTGADEIFIENDMNSYYAVY